MRLVALILHSTDGEMRLTTVKQLTNGWKSSALHLEGPHLFQKTWGPHAHGLYAPL